jgi:hypothetical protein
VHLAQEENSNRTKSESLATETAKWGMDQTEREMQPVRSWRSRFWPRKMSGKKINEGQIPALENEDKSRAAAAQSEITIRIKAGHTGNENPSTW